MSCKLKPACQLIITWKSNINEVHVKPKLHLSVNLFLGIWPPCCWTPSSSLPSSCVGITATASHDNHEKINSRVSFSFLNENGVPLGGHSGRRSCATNECITCNKHQICSIARIRFQNYLTASRSSLCFFTDSLPAYNNTTRSLSFW